jgi:hypothetical protein
MAQSRAPVRLIIPSAVDPPVRGAGQARVVKVEHPTVWTTLTTRAWPAWLARVDGARVDGGRDDQLPTSPNHCHLCGSGDHLGARAPLPEA